MAPQALLSGFVDLEFGRVRRMFSGRTVAVLALNNGMRCLHNHCVLVTVAVLAVLF
jgi:hypothetical protein